MSNKFVYVLQQKSTGIPVQDVFLSRQEARETKRLYEQRDGTKYSIVRYEQNGVIR